MSKSTKKFLRMKSYLKRVMSRHALRKYHQNLEDWRDCQALVMCGFRISGTGSKGTYFDIPGLSDILQGGLKKGFYEPGN